MRILINLFCSKETPQKSYEQTFHIQRIEPSTQTVFRKPITTIVYEFSERKQRKTNTSVTWGNRNCAWRFHDSCIMVFESSEWGIKASVAGTVSPAQPKPHLWAHRCCHHVFTHPAVLLFPFISPASEIHWLVVFLLEWIWVRDELNSFLLRLEGSESIQNF